MKRNLSVVLSLMVLASLILAACGGGNAAATQAPATEVPATAAPVTSGPPEGSFVPFPDGGKTVTGAWTQEPDNVVPYYTQMSYAVWIAQLTLVGLGEWDDKGNFVAELAAEVPTADN